ncbi:sodium:phosphate symporter [candidate division SR1 bacterium]|nr:sodium:phosphate symporter [candidate division SR1 bacterium]
MLTGLLEFLGGLGIFLFSVKFLEESVSGFTRGGFKKLIKKFTSKNIYATLTGILSTVVVQSSNLMSVLVLAFVGTGLLTLTGGLSVMLGANIGATIPDAFFAIIGLNYDIKTFTFPLLFLGAFGLVFYPNKEKVVLTCKIFIAFALTMLSFSFMKEGLGFLTQMVDLSIFMEMSPRFFFLLGLMLTMLVQSGGAVFIIAITSVSSGLISPEVALPIIFSTYFGSTITVFLASMGQQPAIKKQLAYGHIGFNLLASLLAMTMLPLVIWLSETWLFSSLGVVGTLTLRYLEGRFIITVLLLPRINQISKLFQRIFVEDNNTLSLATQKIQISTVGFDVALLAFKQDLLTYFKECVRYNLSIWDFYLTDLTATREGQELALNRNLDFSKIELKKIYQQNKQVLEHLLDFLTQLNQKEHKKATDSEQISILYQVIIGFGNSSKYLKDVRDRVEDWQRSSSEELKKDYIDQKKMVLEFYDSVIHVLSNLDNQELRSFLHDLLDKIESNDKRYLRMVKKSDEDMEIINLIQVSRYFAMSCISIVESIDFITLNSDEKKFLKEQMSHRI